MVFDIRSKSADSGHLSCAYCHDPVIEDGHTCPTCQTILHNDCQRELGRCPTLGCIQAVRPAESMVIAINHRQSPTEAPRWRPLAFLGLSQSRNLESDLSIFVPFAAFITKTLMLLGLGVVLLNVLRFSGGALAEALSPTGAGYNPVPILITPIVVVIAFRLVKQIIEGVQELS